MAARFLAFTALLLGRGHALPNSPYADYFLPTPTIATPLNTTAGFDILLKPTTLRRSYVALAPHFATQSTQSYCAVASSVMALNALPAVAAPVDGAYKPYAYWTQDVLASTMKAVRDPMYGMSRDQLTAALALVPDLRATNVSATAAWNNSADELRRLVKHALSDDAASHVLANFYRKDLDEAGGGHWSPLAAYDADGDLALLLDVARYKYPPVWVPLADLAKAMVAGDADNAGGAPRGVLVLAAN